MAKKEKKSRLIYSRLSWSVEKYEKVRYLVCLLSITFLPFMIDTRVWYQMA